ncbi:terpenoid synthase [Gymnopus androsaceus JB14]|uniref:Terpene synthase n=1 Tax=Gymnopus androsaceus JB14 TaxID=1447944 RepID=A0A6A4GMB7_9AGAR|nr:terpenoid synthase [Gymnopus androsaceus JB14]
MAAIKSGESFYIATATFATSPSNMVQDQTPLRLGIISTFPPKAGQPFPPARNHPRWKELYVLHDEFLMKEWPFTSEKERQKVPRCKLAGFSTWCAPGADFDRMIWGARLAGIFFLADDYIDSGKELDRIPGFKKAAEAPGLENLLHPEDRAEIAHHIVFAAIKKDLSPYTFRQFIKLTWEWWDSNVHESFQNLDQYLAVRRVNIAIYMSNAWFRYTLGINLSDEEVFHPLMREAEGIVSDHVGLVNDYFSYLKEKLSNSDDTNIIRILMDHEACDYISAAKIVVNKIRQKERDFIAAGLAVINDPVLGKNSEVHRWVANMPYVMGGNNAWSQTSGRYNLGYMEGEVEFPSLDYVAEETPAAE